MDIFKVKLGGINYDEGLKRFGNKSELYEKFLKKFFEEPTFLKLQKNILERNYTEAFACAHTMKGTSGNLSIQDFYNKICILVEALRNGRTENLDRLMAEVSEIYLIAKEAIE